MTKKHKLTRKLKQVMNLKILNTPLLQVKILVSNLKIQNKRKKNRKNKTKEYWKFNQIEKKLIMEFLIKHRVSLLICFCFSGHFMECINMLKKTMSILKIWQILCKYVVILPMIKLKKILIIWKLNDLNKNTIKFNKFNFEINLKFF